MTRNNRISFSLVIAFFLGIPFKWIIFKGNEAVSVFQIFELGMLNMYFDVVILAINTFIIYFVLSQFLKLKI